MNLNEQALAAEYALGHMAGEEKSTARCLKVVETHTIFWKAALVSGMTGNPAKTRAILSELEQLDFDIRNPEEKEEL